jgi:hypothetical protein
MKYALIYTTQATREKTREVVKTTGKTLDEVCYDLILKGIPLVTWDDLVNVSREAKVRASFETLHDYTTMKNSIPFHGYRKKGRYNEFLGLALEKALPRYGITTIEYTLLTCISDSDVKLLQYLHPTSEVKGMVVKVYYASDEALNRLTDLVNITPGISFKSNPLEGEFKIIKVNGWMHTIQRGEYTFNAEIKEGRITIYAPNTSKDEIIGLSRDWFNSF